MAADQATSWSNWTRLETVRPARVIRPRSVAEVSAAVAAAAEEGLTVKAVGAGHSFNDIAVARDVQLDLSGLAGILRADTQTGLVTVAAGMPLHELSPRLWDLGLAMANLGDIDRQNLAGAISTGTHGTGTSVAAGIAAQVRELELVLADGSVVTCSAQSRPELFEAARIGLGAFGVITAVTVQCVPAYHLRSQEQPMPLAEAVDRLAGFADAPHNPEFYWFPHTETVLWKLNSVAADGDAPGPLPGWKAFLDDELVANGLLGAISGVSARYTGTIRRINGLAPRFFGRREYVDRSYRVYASSRRVRFREGEFAVPVEALTSVMADLQEWFAKQGNEIGFPMEVRIGPAEDLWLSTAHGRRTAWIAGHTHWRQPHEPFIRELERIVAAHDGRPHWGKLHHYQADTLSRLYPRFGDVLAVRDKVDPQRVFRSAYTDRVLGL
jgi:L-gulonolactone oxidase